MRKHRKHGVVAAVSLVAGLAGLPSAHAQTVIKYVPQADINVLDPVVNKSPVVTQYGYMVYDQLFAVDGNYQPKPQMVDTFNGERGRQVLYVHAAKRPQIP